MQPANAAVPISVIELENSTFVNAAQFSNVWFLTFENEPEMVAVASFLQSLNTASPIVVTEEGMVIDVNAAQPEKADSPIDLSDSGSVTEVIWLQSANAELPIEVRVAGNVTDFKSGHS